MTQDPKTALMEVESADAATTLIARAIDKSVPIETMERLLAMRRELKAEAAREAFYLALAAFQSECPVIEKHKAVAGRDGKTRYHYAPLEDIVSQVKEILYKHGFSYTMHTEQKEGELTGICRAHHISGHTEETQLVVPVGSEYMTKQQMVGAARTYATRYAFCNAFGILTGDEDNDATDDGTDAEGEHRDAGPGRVDQSEQPQKALHGVNVKPLRPFQPELVRSKIHAGAEKYAAEGRKASDKQRQLVAMLLSECFDGDDAKRHSVVGYLFTKDSLAKDACPDWNILALLDWMAPVADSGGAYAMSAFAQLEARMILDAARVEAGEIPLPGMVDAAKELGGVATEEAK